MYEGATEGDRDRERAVTETGRMDGWMDTLVGGCVCARFPICTGTQHKWEICRMP